MKHVFEHPPQAPNPDGRKYWRNEQELQDTPEFRGWLEREFPAGGRGAGGRRAFQAQLLAVDGRIARAGGLRAQRLPAPGGLSGALYKGVEWAIPGKLVYYATSMPRRRGAMPLIAATTEGRPIKLEGNGLHPASNGATDPLAQAALLDLYDPDRSRSFLHQGNVVGPDALRRS